MLRKTKWALCLVACLLIANVYAGGGESCPDGTTQYGDKCCENGKCCHASVNSKRCSAICCESGVIVTNVNLDTNNPNCAGWSNPHDNYGTETCTSPGSTFCQYSGRETGNCKGSQCGIAGTINYRETWKDSQCTYHETNSDISCKSVNELTASTTTISPPRNHEPVGPEVLVVSGCSGAGCANGQCNCNGVNNWRAAATWGCAPLGAPIVKYLSQQWNLQNVWQPAVTLSWREYPLGFDDVQYTNNLVRPNPSSSAWPTTTRTFYIVNSK
ncbi:uncharacterized protein EV422DRAFT_160591 [Fimicolochytrium jonesii]|uniref:uncharacterized protein n=1 Tax=Fimicolochytrium jonesii TaxID=1396493 RepID=UPI0022FEB0D6|nr:uncharacterized protein EV422DRAFT_160591 [Fimicolochytrium jonesii]KAI8826272.1 hypothetical protein EV422DRAFT_160591 [Fimicolochytrium jonesii]